MQTQAIHILRGGRINCLGGNEALQERKCGLACAQMRLHQLSDSQFT
jgi:hypothetical protein